MPIRLVFWRPETRRATVGTVVTSSKLKTYPRKRPSQARASATVEAVLSAAATAFEQNGFDRANVNEIAERAGVSVGSLYQYYPSKEALLVALIERHTTHSLELLESALSKAATLPLDAAVRDVIRVMIDAHRAPLHQLLARELDELGRLEGLQHEVDARAGAAVRSFLAARAAEIQIRDVDMSAFMLVRTVDLLTHAVISDRPDALESGALLEELTTLVLGYLVQAR
jgi:AcrR family transcriptional regulator